MIVCLHPWNSRGIDPPEYEYTNPATCCVCGKECDLDGHPGELHELGFVAGYRGEPTDDYLCGECLPIVTCDGCGAVEPVRLGWIDDLCAGCVAALAKAEADGLAKAEAGVA